ncbi:heterokaryon incompatibility protein-domain-containing protein [Phyllosticta citribraziliensis]|uniref:Heterokaryon incompatibility protein-domain-containing protein n=1 Tax=Phyllosticta citribraziliensis TaxID=989973 RepID=A0ABR1LSE6_9PEZI
MRILCSVEVFTVANTPSPFPCVGSAQILPQNSSRDRLDRAKEWLNHCLRIHERCRRPEEENYPLPRRLVDVSGPKEDGPVRLIETSNHERPYLCLSHCWGDPGRHPLRTLEGGHPIEGDETNLTEGNLDSHMKGIAFHDLPGTFRDAVSVVRALGQRYLWIDSLCIIQDSGKDWDQEAKRMADIYQNSYLTLAATKSMDSTGGLFSEPGAEYNARAFSVKDTNHNSYNLYCRKARPHWFGQTDRSEYQSAPTLLSRAWVYQERVLSPRTLHFGQEELLWECREGSTCECSLWPVPNKQCLRFDSDFSPGIMEVGANWQTKTVTNRWRSAVEEYSSLDMTKPKDRLPAIAGVAKQVQLLRGGERYYVGLWEKSLLEDLLWYVPDRWQVNRTTERAPSWTWACVDKGPITFYSLDEFMHEQPDPIERLAEVVEVELGDGDAFLGVQAGSIKLNGLLFAATVTCDEEGEFVVLLDSDKDDDPWWWFKNRKFFPDFDFWSSDIPESSGGAVLEENMYCFLTHMTYPYDAGPKFSFLALRPKGEEKEGEPTFERVGLVTTLTPVIDWDLDGGKHGADRDPQTITIV